MSASASATLTIGRQSAGFIQRGHPWVRPDRFTQGLELLQPGQIIQLVDERGKKIAAALADPQAEICARVYHRDANTAFDPAALVAKAWKRRGRFHLDKLTDCYRVIHGEADGLPGLRVERYADVFVIVVFAATIEPYLDSICATLANLLTPCRIIIRYHLDDLRREAVTTRAYQGDVSDPDTIVQGQEFGVQLPLRPFEGLATGIYLDQRGTRRVLRKDCAQWDICNLFAYTGLFSLSLLHAGAATAVDVDVAAPALERATEAAVLNKLSDRHRTVQTDCISFLRDDKAQYDCILSDPPTAAQSGQGGWVARRDYPALLAVALPRLKAGGIIIACSNTLGAKPADPDACVREASVQTGIAMQAIAAPELDPDIPQLAEFPEGRPFRLAVYQRQS